MIKSHILWLFGTYPARDAARYQIINPSNKITHSTKDTIKTDAVCFTFAMVGSNLAGQRFDFVIRDSSCDVAEKARPNEYIEFMADLEYKRKA